MLCHHSQNSHCTCVIFIVINVPFTSMSSTNKKQQLNQTKKQFFCKQLAKLQDSMRKETLFRQNICKFWNTEYTLCILTMINLEMYYALLNLYLNFLRAYKHPSREPAFYRCQSSTAIEKLLSSYFLVSCFCHIKQFYFGRKLHGALICQPFISIHRHLCEVDWWTQLLTFRITCYTRTLRHCLCLGKDYKL